jgi:peptidoglycan/LPS O-acetylase OafA/YrhL
LITYLILNEVILKARLDVRAFYMRRILRIWPLYYLVIAFAFIGYPLLSSLLGLRGSENGNPLYFVFFLSNFAAMHLKDAAGAMVGVTLWSVAVEEQFYVIWSLLFYFIRPRFYRYIFLAVILASAIFRLHYIHDQYISFFTR